MKPSWGKIRIGAIASLGVIAFALSAFIVFSVAPRAYSAELTPTLLITDGCSHAVTAYSAASNGDVSPLAPAPTRLAEPQSVAIDASGKIYVTNYCFASLATITIYAKGSNGDAAPIATIGGSNTGLKYAEGIAVDSSGKIYVADLGAKSVFVYSALGSSTGLLNEAPIAAISGTKTGLNAPYGIALDSSGKIYVVDWALTVCLSMRRGAAATSPPSPPSAGATPA